jgi:hypothetical protein
MILNVRLQLDVADCTNTLEEGESSFHLCDLPGIPPQFLNFPGIYRVPANPTTTQVQIKKS